MQRSIPEAVQVRFEDLVLISPHGPYQMSVLVLHSEL